MSYSTQTLHDRMAGLAGRPAEAKFLAELERTKGYRLGERVWKFGLDNLQTAGNGGAVATLAPYQLHMPDFVTAGGHLYEVQGGRDGQFVIKDEKFWNLHDVWLPMTEGSGKRYLRWFFWDMTADECWWVTHEGVCAALDDPRTVRSEANPLVDGKATWTVPAAVFADMEVLDAFEANKAWRKRIGADAPVVSSS